MNKKRKILVSLLMVIYIISGLIILYLFMEYIVNNIQSLMQTGILYSEGNGLTESENFIFDLIVLIFYSSSLVLSIYQIIQYIFPSFHPRKRNSPINLTTTFDIIRHISTEDEVSVLEVLRQLEPRAYKFEIARKSGLSKMKIHRIIIRLQERDIVEVSKVGRNSQVKLREWILT